MSNSPRPTILPYGIAISVVCLALAATLQLGFLAKNTPFALFYAAVMVSTWYGGRGPGITSIALSALASEYFLIQEVGTILPSRLSLLEEGIFISVALLINSLAVARSRGEKLLMESENRYRVQAATAERNRAKLEAVIHAVADGIMVSDMSGNFILANEAEARITGYATPEEMNQNLAHFAEVFEFETLEGEPLPVEDWPLSKVIRGESFLEWELRGRRKDTGREWRFSFSGRPVRDERGEPALAVIVTRDVTERRELEEQLRQSLKLESVGQLAGGIAHDFNNLLTVISGYSELALRRLNTEDPLRPNIEEIKKAAAMGLLDGVTTNPSLLAKSGKSMKKALAEIC